MGGSKMNILGHSESCPVNGCSVSLSADRARPPKERSLASGSHLVLAGLQGSCGSFDLNCTFIVNDV